MPQPVPLAPCPDLLVHDLQEQAHVLRVHADAIDAELQALRAFDRPDVWEGAKATAFRIGFADQLRRLAAPGTGVTDVLRAAAGRIEQRAAGLAATPGAPDAPCTGS